MRPNDFAGTILEMLRRNESSGCTLRELTNKVAHGAIDDSGFLRWNTLTGVLGGLFTGLSAEGFITLTHNSQNDVGELLSQSNENRSSYSYNGEAVRILRQFGSDSIIVRATKKLYVVQNLLGFSITDLAKSTEDSIKVTPFFRAPKPRGRLQSDIFVLMPFGDEIRPVYEDHIKAACAAINMSCNRADDFFGTNQVMDDVWSAIFHSKIIIADCTGRNPNVFYEMGIAHTIGKPLILITQHKDDVPFDIRHIRYIEYEFSPRGMKRFENVLAETIASIG